MDRYDFEKRYPPLPRLDQDGHPTCVLYTRAQLVNAHVRMAYGTAPMWGPDRVSWSPDPDDGACGFIIAAPSLRLKARNDTCDHPGIPPEVEAIKVALAANGVLECGVPSRAPAFAKAWGGMRVGGRLRMPVLQPTAHGPTTIDHDIPAVGFTRAGVIVHNQWGEKWGKNGRAVLSWAFIARYGVSFLSYTFSG